MQHHYNELDDEELYRHARLVTSAVIAKIHTIDWTVELLKTDTLLAGMRANWYIISLLHRTFQSHCFSSALKIHKSLTSTFSPSTVQDVTLKEHLQIQQQA